MRSLLEQVQDQQKQRLDELIQHVGTVAYLALILELPYTTVKSWEDRGRISKDGAKAVEEHEEIHFKFTVKYLRPDIR